MSSSVEQQLRDVNEALLVSSVHQHELAEKAEHAEEALRHSNKEIKRAWEYAEAILRTSPVPLLVLESDMRVVAANDAFYKRFMVAPDQTAGRLVYELGNGQWNIPRLRELLEGILPRHASFENLEVTHSFESLGPRTMLLNARRMEVQEDGPERIVLVIEDITVRKQAEENLRETEERNREALNAAQMGTWRADLRAGTGTRDANLNRILGLDAVQSTQAIDDCFRLVNPEDKPQAIAAWQRCIETRGVYEAEFGITRDDGSRAWLREYGRFMPGRDGKADQVTGITIDISERKQAEDALRDSEERFRMLADNMAQLAWTCDKLGNVTWYNQRWLDYTGMSFDDMKGWNWSKVQHPDHLERVVQRVQRSAEAGATWEDTFPLRGKEGEYRWFLSRAVPIHDRTGHIVRWFGTNTDITEQRETQQALDMAREAAEAANRSKDKFLAVLSHELRTPLTPVVLAITAMEHDPDLPLKMRDDLAMVRRNVELETKLIDDLLDLSRVTSGKLRLQLEPISAHTVLRHVIESSARDTSERRLSVSLELHALRDQVIADPSRLQQVFWNLFRNAIKFTPEGGRISFRSENDRHGRLRLEVQDTGMGIPPDVLPKVFDAFEQGDVKTTRHFGGLGLGLAICKAVVEMHGGTIRAESDGTDKGATFIIELPTAGIREARAEQSEAPNEADVALRSRLLLVEDHPDTVRALSRLLGRSGFQVKTASSIASALQLAASEPFDILVSDIGLPDGTGYELMEQIRDRYGIKGIALSGYGMEDDIRRSMEAGFSEHVVKPVDLARLESVVRQVVRGDGCQSATEK